LAQVFGREVWQGSLVLVVMMRVGLVYELVDHPGWHATHDCFVSTHPFKHLQLALQGCGGAVLVISLRAPVQPRRQGEEAARKHDEEYDGRRSKGRMGRRCLKVGQEVKSGLVALVKAPFGTRSPLSTCTLPTLYRSPIRNHPHRSPFVSIESIQVLGIPTSPLT
jgi:hypothetical protein